MSTTPTHPVPQKPGLLVSDSKAWTRFKDLSKGLLGAVMPGGKLLATLGWGLMERTLGTQDTTDWDAVFAGPGGYVKKKELEDQLKEAKKTLSTIVKSLRTDYVPKRDASTTSRATLGTILAPLVFACRSALETLEDDQVRWYGLEAYVYGVDMLLSLMQEQALQDPDVLVPAETVGARVQLPAEALERAATAEATILSIVEARLALITPVEPHRDKTMPGGQSNYKVQTGWLFRDELVGYQFFKDADKKQGVSLDDAESIVINERIRYVEAARRAYLAEFDAFLGMIADWRRAAEQPVGYGPPGTAPTVDLWAQNVPFGPRWVRGARVRYRVTFVDEQGVETLPGPWWSPPGAATEPKDERGYLTVKAYAVPQLVDIPLAAVDVRERRVYRQFEGDVEELVLTLEDNITRVHYEMGGE
jgi:hypothetical protein